MWHKRRGIPTRWYPRSGLPFLNRLRACMYPPTNHNMKMEKKVARIIHLIISPFCSEGQCVARVAAGMAGELTSVYQKPLP
jgi:hypothetical protein